MTLTPHWLASVHRAVVRAIEEQDAAGFAALYTQDGTLMMPDGQIVSGREAIERKFAAWLDAGFVRQDVAVTDFVQSEDLAIEVGNAAGTFQTVEGMSVSRSNYLIVHRRDKDGTWGIYRDIWTAVSGEQGSEASY
jgi:uncharacterized protein (TIGR02246 family)